jgi:cytoskeleton protein RodZ
LVVESQAIEQLKSIVAQLKQAREAKELKLEDIAAKTFIPLRLLKAMDEERFERLPEPVFVQGFIRRYAEQVGLDGQAMARQFEVMPPMLTKPAEEFLVPDDDKSGPSAQATPAESRIKDKVTAPEAAPYNPTVSSDWSDETVGGAAKALPWFYWAGAATGAVLLGVGLASLLGKSNSSQPVASPSIATTPPPSIPKTTAKPVTAPSMAPPETIQLSPSPEASPSPSLSPSPSPSPSPAAAPTGPNTITLSVTDNSWVEVVVDGKPLLAEELPKGTQKTISGKTIEVYSGNAGGVSVGTNQGAPQPLGAPGQLGSKVFGQATP